MEPNVGRADELGMERQAGHGPRPAVHERDGDHRAHGRLALRQVGAVQRLSLGDRGRHHALGGARVDHEVPPRAMAEADRHAERHVALGWSHRQRHRRPVLPLRQRRRWWALRARVGRGRVEWCTLGSGQDEGARVEVDTNPTEAGKDIGAEQADRLTLPLHLGQRGCRQLLRSQLDAVE